MNNWRFRFLISCFTLLPEEFVISDYKLCCKKDGRNISGDIIYRIDIFTKTPDIQKAFSECLDLVDEVLDRIAFLANSKVGLLSIVSITRPYVKSEQEFEVGVPTGSFSNSNADISRQHLEDFSVDDLKSRLMRCFRLGCSSADSYTRYKNLWLLLELLAEQKAKDEGWKLDKKCHKCEEVIHCPKCGVESPVIPDQQRGIIYFLSRFSVDNKHTPEEIAKNGRRLRGKLIHGGKLSNLKLADEVSAMTVAIYATVLSSLSEYLNKKCLNKRTAIYGNPLLIITCKYEGNPLKVKNVKSIFEVKAAFPEVEDKYAENQKQNFFFGINFNELVLPEIALPDLKE